tara:strand:- start:999 stop:1250 length:252 start_codon:yes stop_codon:yes gene_type:complete
MKRTLIYILTIIPLIAFGQKSNTVFSTGSNDLFYLTYSDFQKSGVKKMEAYSFEIKKNGGLRSVTVHYFFRKKLTWTVTKFLE